MHYLGEVGRRNSTIGLLLQTKYLSATTISLATLPHYPTGRNITIGREPAALFLVKRNNRPVFLLAVVHFKAQGGGAEDYTRKALAIWLRDELENSTVNCPCLLLLLEISTANRGRKCLAEKDFGRFDVLRLHSVVETVCNCTTLCGGYFQTRLLTRNAARVMLLQQACLMERFLIAYGTRLLMAYS